MSIYNRVEVLLKRRRPIQRIPPCRGFVRATLPRGRRDDGTGVARPAGRHRAVPGPVRVRRGGRAAPAGGLRPTGPGRSSDDRCFGLRGRGPVEHRGGGRGRVRGRGGGRQHRLAHRPSRRAPAAGPVWPVRPAAPASGGPGRKVLRQTRRQDCPACPVRRRAATGQWAHRRDDRYALPAVSGPERDWRCPLGRGLDHSRRPGRPPHHHALPGHHPLRPLRTGRARPAGARPAGANSCAPPLPNPQRPHRQPGLPPLHRPQRQHGPRQQSGFHRQRARPCSISSRLTATWPCSS
jgi:hypothetical protein